MGLARDIQHDDLTLGEFRARRVALGLTQAALAAKLGVTPNTVARWERGEQPVGRPERVQLVLDRLAAAAGACHPAALHEPSPREAVALAPETRRSAPPLDNLPAELSTFVGRSAAVAELRQQLRQARLLTLTGPGGVGKTRLALRVAAASRAHFPHGTWFVGLGSLDEPATVPEAVASALGVPERGAAAIEQRLVDHLRVRRLLLILDNCEHLVEACATLAVDLVTRCPSLQILATSREPLNVSGEVTWPVVSLGLPAPDDHLLADAKTSDAVRLFVDRARAIRPDFAITEANAMAVVDVCRRLDGIPLALELAAAHLRTFTPEQLPDLLSDRLRLLADGKRDAPLRQRTLRATIDWSYELLPPEERRLFSCLSVFSGGWRLEAAQRVCGSGAPEESCALLLSRLVARSLVVAEPGADGGARHRLLETIRQYATARLEQRFDAATLREAHARYFMQLAETYGTEEALRGPDAEASLASLTRDLDNVRAAFQWALGVGQSAIAIGLAAAMSHYWDVQGSYTEGRRWFQAVLNLPEARGTTRIRAALLYGYARCVHRQGEYDLGEALQSEGQAIGRELNDPLSEGNALFGLAFNASMRGNGQLAVDRYLQARALYQRCGNRLREAMALVNLAVAESRNSAFEEAREHALEALERAHEIRSGYVLAQALRAVGNATYGLGDSLGAEQRLREAVGLERGLGVQWLLAYSLENLGTILAANNGRADEAWNVLVESIAVHQRTGEAVGVLRCLEVMATLIVGREPSLALLALDAAARARVSLGFPPSPTERSRIEGVRSVAQPALARSAAEQAIADAERLSLDEAVARVLHFGVRTASSSHSGIGQLTFREREVLKLLSSGCTNAEMAAALVISPRTVERHIANVYAKIGARGRADATVYALRIGLD